MAKKQKVIFECQSCGFTTPKWMGKCVNCGAWDSFIEVTEEQLATTTSKPDSLKESKAQSIVDVEVDDVTRTTTGEEEFDTVLGGGAVPGSLVLIGGSPGVGKSTLLLKISANLAKRGNVLYVSAEESGGQIRLRSKRLGAEEPNLYLLSEIRLENIKAELKEREYSTVVIDSIQTIYSEDLNSSPGSVSQVREITFELMRIAKQNGITIFIIGHITKEGSIAGPRVLEHMVDTVLYFEGDGSKEIRILRSFKNRFGSTSEVGIFQMSKQGLVSATELGGMFYSSNRSKPGSAIAITQEGTRSIAVEVQALVSESGYGNPKRSTTGFDNNRLTMLLALLEKKLEIAFNGYDVFINIAGGIKIAETAIDLAVIAAILSSLKNRAISEKTIFLGEVSLIGDIREVTNLDGRLKEAVAQGFEKAIVAKKPMNESKIKCFQVDEVVKLLDWM
ncbi:MAG: DNA repair protein RadA [Campylobacterales bacterium]|nr:DNA repair protein RadA [Campylobacterales bacterium]